MVTDRELNAMMADGLLNTVRDAAKGLYGVNQIYPCDDVKRMSADITRLRAENERLRTALEPFSKASDGFDTMPVKNPEEWFAYGGVKPAGQDAQGAITVGDLRRARAALGDAND